MNIVIVDKDTDFTKAFCELVHGIFREHDLGNVQFQTYHTVKDFTAEYKLGKTDLLFLERHIGENSGVDLAKNLRRMGDETDIVFLGSQSEDVYRTFAVSPLYFIRKERLEEETKVAVGLYIDKILRPGIQVKLRLKRGDRECNLMQIKYVKKLQNDILVCFGDNRLLKRRGTLKEVEEKLVPYYFVRVDNGCLLNMGYVDYIKDQKVSLFDGTEIVISRRRKKEVEQMYRKYISEGRDRDHREDFCLDL